MRTHAIPIICLLTILAFGIAGSSARAQTPPASSQPEAVPVAPTSPFDGTLIRELTVSGLERIDESYIRNQMRTRAGQAYSADQVQRDVGRLLRTGRFLDIKAEPSLVAGQINLNIRVVEKSEVAALEFDGAKKFKRKELLEALSFGVGDPLDLYEVRQGREAIERLYHEKGYAYAEITIDEEALKSQRVVYNITENQRVRIRSIQVEGNTTYDDRELRAQISSNTWFPIFRKGDFDPEKAQRDAVTIQNYYRDRGFLDAEVAYETEYQDAARERLTLLFRVNEGVRYKIREIRVEGNQVFTTDEILGAMALQAGPDQFYNAITLKSDVEKVETKYGSVGYIEARAASAWVYATEPEQVVITITVSEGGLFRVGWIEVNGNFRTKEKTVRRELRFIPEEIYDVTRLRDAEKRLKSTGLFSEARIEPVGTGPDVRDAIVSVTENPKTNQFIAGVGASSDNGFTGNIVLENTNFDIFDRPRSWDEFFRGRSFRGAGQTMRIQFEPGTEFTRFRIDFREPYFLNKPIGFNATAFGLDRGRNGYRERRLGGGISFDKKFEEGLLKSWLGEVAFNLQEVWVLERVGFAAKDIRDTEGANFEPSVKFTLVHDTTDSRMDPSRGHRFQIGYEQFYGDHFFGRFLTEAVQHFTVAVDEQDRKSVVSLRASMGQLLGDSPVYERFYAGGIGSFRGFDFRGISPRDGLRNNRIGGDFQILTGAEYSFPIWGKAVRGVAFTDMGTVERDFGITSWRASVGAGVRLTLDILGGIPMEFDLAYPIASRKEDDVRYFSFFVGLPFF